MNIYVSYNSINTTLGKLYPAMKETHHNSVYDSFYKKIKALGWALFYLLRHCIDSVLAIP